MRRGFGIIGLVLTLIVIAAVGVIAYQVGWSDGFAQHVQAATNGGTTAVAPYPYGYGWYGGPGFFHIGFGQPSQEAVNAINRRLKEDGYDVPAPSRQHGSWTFYFTAPGGFLIEVLC